MAIRIISAGAGSGKTFRLTSELVEQLRGGVRAEGIIATTFTQKAAAELQERVRVRLLKEGLTREADQLSNALIGTVHGLGVKLLKRFAYEAGVSPQVSIIADEDQQTLFNQALANVLNDERVAGMERLVERFGLAREGRRFDWRSEVRKLTEIARANDLDAEALEKSKILSFETFRAFLNPTAECSGESCDTRLARLLDEAIDRLENNEDGTKKTQSAAATLRESRRELHLRGELTWPDWAKIGKLDVGAKSREDVKELVDFARRCDANPAFHADLRAFIHLLFDISLEALLEYEQYKKRRGLIDYTDMEGLVKRLLDHPQVAMVLREEIDLLLVDEFQDTNPIQLEIFLKLSRLAGKSIWVGDPKQSIYGFRGAAPALMQAIIDNAGGIRPSDIQEYSWRSRADLVFAVNAIFTRAFDYLPPEQIALKPKRILESEPLEAADALLHWHFRYEGEGRKPGGDWLEHCIAEALQQLLASKLYILPKGESNWRAARAGDVAILCRSNRQCQSMAEALARAGLRAAIARSGLLNTAESTLVLACMKYILHPSDSLSVAEALLLGQGWSTEEIIEHRLTYLENTLAEGRPAPWALEQPLIARLNELRGQVAELSSAEIINLLLEELDLRRIIAGWGNAAQRLDNVDELRGLALRYEETCNRLHSSASLGGFLLWLNELQTKGLDKQGSGEGPDAVQVLTYHKSKGLEWPIVICHSLEDRLKAELWGIDLVSEKQSVNIDRLLGDRWLRYWINPFGLQIRNTPLDERMNDSPHKAANIERARREDVRLLYVGLTRARDYLVFCSGYEPTRWLNRVFQGDDEKTTLSPDTHETPWEWEGRFLDARTETFVFPREFPYAEWEPAPVDFLAPRAGKVHYPAHDIDLRRESFAEVFNGAIGQQWTYAGAEAGPEGVDAYAWGKMTKAFLLAFHPQDAPEHHLDMAKGHLMRFIDASSQEAPALLVAAARAFFRLLHETFAPRRIQRKYPIRYAYGGRHFETVLDFVLETEQGLVLVQNSGFAGGPGKWNNHALGLLDWCGLSELALRTVFADSPVRVLIHFVLGGALLEVTTAAKTTGLKL